MTMDANVKNNFFSRTCRRKYDFDRTSDIGDWTVNGSNADLGTEAGGIQRLTTGTTATNVVNVQHKIGVGYMTLGRRVETMFRVRAADLVNSRLWFGIAITDTTLVAGVNDCIALYRPEGANTGFKALVRAGGADVINETIALTGARSFGNLTQDEWMNISLEIIMDDTVAGQGTVRMWVVENGERTNDYYQATFTGLTTNAVFRESIEIYTTEAAANVLDLDAQATDYNRDSIPA